MAEGRKWYVQPGGQGEREKWLEGDRVIWEVPQELLFDKVGRRCSALPCRVPGQDRRVDPDVVVGIYVYTHALVFMF